MSERIALALLSGGLDSILAARIVRDMPKIRVVGYHFHHPFTSPVGKDGRLDAERQARELGIPIIVDADDDAFIGMTKHPLHGRGKGANPCRDCRIFILKHALKMLEMIHGDFLVSGEVLGQRPMSQVKNALNLIEKRAGVRGILLRPLSAKLLPPTLPETGGWIERDALLGFSGRDRKGQMALADSYGIVDYPQPAGGCPLTELAFSVRYFDLLENAPDFGIIDVKSLYAGRHFRLPNGFKLIIARDEAECDFIYRELAEKFWIIDSDEIPGPAAAIDREPNADELAQIGGLVASYGKARALSAVGMTLISPSGERSTFTVKPLDKKAFQGYLL